MVVKLSVGLQHVLGFCLVLICQGFVIGGVDLMFQPYQCPQNKKKMENKEFGQTSFEMKLKGAYSYYIGLVLLSLQVEGSLAESGFLITFPSASCCLARDNWTRCF